MAEIAGKSRTLLERESKVALNEVQFMYFYCGLEYH